MLKIKRPPGRPTENSSELAQLRKKLNMSQATAAAVAAGLLGSCDPRTWRSWEGGKKPPPVVAAHFRRLVETIK